MGILDIFKSEINRLASTHLGKKSNGCDFYNPSLLVAIPRIENRKQYNINEYNLPFEGFDIWQAYEFSCMTENGIPVTRLIKLKYPCDSRYIIESKSLKLYLNSFNMFKLGKTIQECLEICLSFISKDLSSRLETFVDVEIVDTTANKTRIFSQFENIMNYVDESKLIIDIFKESPNLLGISSVNNSKIEHYLAFDSLRSNCRVTHQPDFGDVFIYYNSAKHIDEASLVKYLVSFRSEYHFHEECCEMIFKRLSDLLDASDELFVAALYTRRGGIDISPIRWSGDNIKTKPFFADVETLLNLKTYARFGVKQ